MSCTLKARQSVVVLIDPLVKKATGQRQAPKFSNKVDVFTDYDDGSKRFVATLNLEKLGWGTHIKRLCGRISEIYVLETPEDTKPEEAKTP